MIYSFNVTQDNLQRIYTPVKKERLWLKRQRFTAESTVVCIVLLKCFQRLGHFPNVTDIPPLIASHIGNALALEADFYTSIDQMPTSSQRWLKTKIREYCQVDKFKLGSQGVWLKAAALTYAKNKETIVDIVNAMLELLIKERTELPALSTLERIAITARSKTNDNYFNAIANSLSASAKQELLRLLNVKVPSGETHWHQIKREPEKPGVRTLNRFIEHIDWLKNLQSQCGDLPELPELKHLQFISEAQSYDAEKMRAIKLNKRLALLALLVREQLLRSTDNLVNLFIKEIRKLHSKSQEDLKTFQSNAVSELEQLVYMLRDISNTVSNGGTKTEQHKTIVSLLGNAPEKVANRCDRLVSFGLTNPLQFLSKRYTRPLRKALLDCLVHLDIDHTAHGSQLLACVNAILTYQTVPMKTIAVSALLGFSEDNDIPLDWVKESWHSVLYADSNRQIKNRFMNNDNFELCVLSEVSRRFQSGDLYVGNSTIYDDYRTDLVSWAEFYQLVDAFCEVAGIDKNPAVFVKTLKHNFNETARKADASIPTDSHIVIENGKLSLKKRPSAKTSAAHKSIDLALKDLVPEVSIVDLLAETTQWLNLGKKFGPLSGHKTKVRDYTERLVATLFCYGCNLGPTQTARSIKDLSRKQIAYLNLSHTREKDLRAATEDVINAYNQYELPRHWGSGATASVDGTRFDMYEQNIMSEYHLRYASYGGIGYYLVSDKYIALFSRFIPCGVREALHLLDGILDNTSDIQPDTIHGDTHAQSTVVFGLAHLLGIKLMPRIKDINSMIFFKPDGRSSYPHIDALFSENINYSLITDNYKYMLRVAVSISEGKVSASTMIRRLGSNSIRNSLFYAFRELGRVVRTQFLLQYISEIELRESVHAATCKSEEFNQFVQWVFFYNNGMIQENLRHAQDKMIAYNHLVANLVILHNVDSMSKAINKLKRQGFKVDAEALRSLSPYRTEHINLLGTYSLKIPKQQSNRNFKLM